jgi:hypothetical protein
VSSQPGILPLLRNRIRDRWFNIDAGFERDPARIPAAFQKRAFPFRIDGVRGMPLMLTNLSIQRNFGAGNGRTWQLRMDAPSRRTACASARVVTCPAPASPGSTWQSDR